METVTRWAARMLRYYFPLIPPSLVLPVGHSLGDGLSLSKESAGNHSARAVFLGLCFLFSLTISTTKAQENTQTPQVKTAKLKTALKTEQPLWYILLIAFATGILVSFTPCIYPMIPITAGILQAQATAFMWYNFLLSLCYVLGVAFVYALLGYIVATSSLIFGQWFASPWFILFIILFFLYFAFAMFGFYKIYIPGFLRSRSMLNTKGSLISTFILGALSGTVTSPCLTPALAIMLGYVAKLGNPLAGFLALFSFALGMGVLLVLVGTFSGMLSLLPGAGSWMLEIKKFFGFLMLGVCIYILQPLLKDFTSMLLYAILLLITSAYYFIASMKTSSTI